MHCVMSGALLCSTDMCKKTTVHMCDNTKFKFDSDFTFIVASQLVYIRGGELTGTDWCNFNRRKIFPTLVMFCNWHFLN